MAARKRPLALETKPFVLARTEAGLAAIDQRGVNLALWERPLPRRFLGWLEDITASHSIERRATLRRRDLDVSVLLADLPSTRGREALADDIHAVVRLFTRLRGVVAVEASLAVVVGDKCRKFHADWKPLRLVCTYAGPGTEWVANAAVRRDALMSETHDMDAANRATVPDPRDVRHANPGDVVVLKGERYRGNAGNGAVHRSPPIEASGKRRLVLTLDMAARAAE